MQILCLENATFLILPQENFYVKMIATIQKIKMDLSEQNATECSIVDYFDILKYTNSMHKYCNTQEQM